MPYRTASAIFLPDDRRSIIRFLLRSRLVWVLLLASLMLSGCVKSEVGVNFESPNRGAIVQHIRLDERLTSFGSGTAKTWLDNIEKRVRRVEGNTRRLSNQEILVTIPFGNGEELETRFNEFFSPINPSRTRSTKKELDLPQLDSHLDVQQGNFLLLQRHRLIYDLDLRSLGVLASDGTLLASPGSLLELEFGLTTPWGARNVINRSKGTPIATHRAGKQLIWTLQPGQSNHLEAVFWLPNPLGIGAVAIVAIVAGGIYLRRALPMPTSPPLASNS